MSPPFAPSSKYAVSPPPRICFFPSPNVDVRLARKLESDGYLELSKLSMVPRLYYRTTTVNSFQRTHAYFDNSSNFMLYVVRTHDLRGPHQNIVVVPWPRAT